ncbi:Z1 domain-containing protein [Dehalococcoides mccartyi]|jgi:hypothetical protein|uniref:Z1 domain-containing protein n=1 Tax=Dehalococcoides mccartyi TaxID=61435 RepID=UPI00069712A4|nr:Z1 domain-containing protein [Dehalococcoides mccartyi]
MNNSPDNINKLENLAHFLVLQRFPAEVPTEAGIKECLAQARILTPVTDEECDKVLKLLYAHLQVTMEIGVAVVDESTYKPWLNERKQDITFYYWDRYRKYLERSKNWNGVVIETLGRVSDEILDLLGNPANETSWQRCGLIMGDVQSGKTANYATLCNKAMDAGYRVLIILAGTQENLRRQTQERLDLELVGLDSQLILDRVGRKLPVGVGRIDGNHFVATFTSKNNDFDQKLLNNLNMRITTCLEPVVFVIKKQKHRLTYLEKWLRIYNAGPDGKIDSPMLLIDDEADNASVNTKDDDDPTTINECIRKLLILFKRASYVGVTATPYANIFINPDNEKEMLGNDLFPRDFIYSLAPPTNYIGNTAIFGDESSHEYVVQDIGDDAEHTIPIKHGSQFNVEDLPESLYTALNYFVLINVIRDIRGPIHSHRSMLVNISRFTNVQSQTRNIIHAWIERIKSAAINFGSLEPQEAMRNSSIKSLYDTWQAFHLSLLCEKDWRTVQQHWLCYAVNRLTVVEVNQRTSSAILDYDAYKDNGFRVIAVGGNSLTRGLTLEGLCVSYFYRNSQAYDTLLQMGRWFGYRIGYEDLCRVWMTDEARECYSHITKATNELRDEIYSMRYYGMTPREFGLKVRSSPGSTERMVSKLLITARNKMRHATDYIHTVSVSAELLETPKIIIDTDRIIGNFNLAKQFVAYLEATHKKADDSVFHSTHNVWVDVPREKVASFIRSYIADPLYLHFQTDGLADFIAQANHLESWDIALPEGDTKEEYCITNKTVIKRQERSVDISPNKKSIRINGAKLRVGSRPCTRYGLDNSIVEEITQRRKQNKQQVPDKDFLMKPDRKPLLLIHFINIKPHTNLEKPERVEDRTLVVQVMDRLNGKKACVVALSVGFPLATKDNTMYVKYKINLVQQELLLEAATEAQNADD